MSRKYIQITFFILLLSGMLLGLAIKDGILAKPLQDDPSGKIEGELLNKFSIDGDADFIIRFTEQADLSTAYSMDWNTRGEFVYNALRDTAARNQANAKAILDAQGLTYQTFIAGNDLYVWGENRMAVNGLAILNELAALPEVNSIRATRTYYIDPVAEVTPFANIRWAGDLLSNNKLTTVGSTDATTAWGVMDTKADQFCTTFGVQGAGIKVANIDTGVQYDHPALDQTFACLGDPTNPDCWLDPSDICAGDAPCDNNGHGTHTMGTMVADDDPSLNWPAG